MFHVKQLNIMLKRTLKTTSFFHLTFTVFSHNYHKQGVLYNCTKEVHKIKRIFKKGLKGDFMKKNTMTIEIGGYVIEVKARTKSIDSRYNEKATNNFANWLSCVLCEMSDHYINKAENTDDTNLKATRQNIADYYREDANKIYKQLDEKGVYDNVKRVLK